MNVYEKALEYREETIAHRRWFHKNAETGLNMPLGQAYVLETLKNYGNLFGLSGHCPVCCPVWRRQCLWCNYLR